MKKSNGLLWGLLLIVVGVILGLNSFGLADINLFFDGWWTLFIIIPSFINLINSQDKTGSIIGLLVGVVLLLAAQNIITFDLIYKLAIPVILVVVGLSIIFKGFINKEVRNKISEKSTENLENVIATFSSQDVKYEEDEFQDVNAEAIFGSVLLDLTDCKLKNEHFIKVCSIFGGIDIKVPSDVNVKVKSTPIFGGVDCKIKNNKTNKKTIYIEAFCLFGGVDIND